MINHDFFFHLFDQSIETTSVKGITNISLNKFDAIFKYLLAQCNLQYDKNILIWFISQGQIAFQLECDLWISHENSSGVVWTL